MASSLEELLAEEGFKGIRRVQRSRSSFHYGSSSEPLYSLEGRFSVSSERIRPQRQKSDASLYQITSGLLKTDPHTAKNRRSRDNIILREEVDERLKIEAVKNSSSHADSGEEVHTKSSEHMPRDEITELNEQEASRFEDTYSNEVAAKGGKEKNLHELVEEKIWREKPAKVQSRSSSINMRRYSNSKSFEYTSRKKNSNLEVQVASGLALDEVAIQAVVSILNGYIKCFPKDEEFRSTLHHRCFSSLNFLELKEEKISQSKVIRSLEQAIEAIEQFVGEPASAMYLKRTTMQLSIITGLGLNDLKYEHTCRIPNYKLSACAHLYLSVVYMMQKKNKVSAKHLLQVFCDSPFQARTMLLPELWEHLFSPQFSHLKAWYEKEEEVLVDTPNKTRRLKLLQEVYNEHLDSGTHIFAVYYKDWLTEGVESPTIPSIGIPSVSVTGSQEGSSLGHSFESASSIDPFSPQPMVSKKLYDSMFGSFGRPGVYQVKDVKDDGNQDNCVKGSHGSTFVKQTLTYESETVKFTDQDIEGFSQGVAIDTIKPHKGNLVAAAEEWQKRNVTDDINNSFSMQTNLNNHIVDALPYEKANDLKKVEPQKFSAYREVAVNAIAEALDGSLNNEKAREKCCRALLILCGHFSSTGKIPTKTSILKQAGYNHESVEVKPHGHQKEGQQSEVTISLEDEDKRVEELLKKLIESLIGDGEGPFLKSISRCLDSKHLDLVRACLITVTWLSSSLSTLFGAGLPLPTFSSIISQLKGILEDGELELKALASLSLLNFSKISECKTLMKTMAEDVAPLLHGLAEVTWTAKQLHAAVSGENL
ncbi:hypothetical protein ACSQ67_023451 [Phaseolus vulgaris]